MRQMVKIIRKDYMDKQYEYILQLELDYELASLYIAMQNHNEDEIAKSKQRLTEITAELEGMKRHVN